jgi:EamA domain-containing membrane protein RarD
MLNEHISIILLVTGIVTALPILQFFVPKPVIKLMYKVEIDDPAGLLFARHWGLMAACFGGLLIYASSHEEVRAPVVAAALLEKAGLVGAIAAAWNEPHAKGLRLACIFDAACTIVFAVWLLSR